MNHTPSQLNGLGIALVTPFLADGSVDYPALQRLVNYQIDNGIDFLVALGTTSEAPCLTMQEKTDVCRCIVDTVQGRLPLVIGCGGNCTANVIDELTHTSLDDFCAVLSVAPFYNKPNQEGLYQHFKAIAQASPKPVILYNVPSRTGVNISAETTLKLATDCPNITAIKEASGNMEQIKAILAAKPQHLTVLSGDDALTLDMMREGASGVISVIGNALPRQFKHMLTLFKEGKETEAEAMNQRFHDLYKLLFADGNPAGIKALLHIMGYTQNTLRLPLTPIHLNIFEKMQLQVQRLQLM